MAGKQGTTEKADQALKNLDPKASNEVTGGDNASPMDPLINTAARNADRKPGRR